MAKFMILVSYRAAGAKGLRKDGGTKRRHVVRKAIESVGGKLGVVLLLPRQIRRRGDCRRPRQHRRSRASAWRSRPRAACG